MIQFIYLDFYIFIYKWTRIQKHTGFPQCFPKALSHSIPWCPHSGEKDQRPAPSIFVLKLRTLNIKNSLPLLWIFSLLSCSKSSESSTRGKAGFLINISFLWVNFQNSHACWFACFMFLVLGLRSNRQWGDILAPHSVSAAKGRSPGSLLVERSLILKSAVEPTVVAWQPCTSSTYLSCQHWQE